MLNRLLTALLLAVVAIPLAYGATLLPNGEQTFLDNNGLPIANGKVYFYVPNTTQAKDTYQNSGQTVLNANPVPLDGSGRAVIYGAGIYRQILQDALGNTIWDKLTADTSSNNFSWAGTSTGTANAIKLTAPSFTQADGQVIGFVAGLSNSAATTVSVNNGTPINLNVPTSAGPVPLSGGEIVVNNQYQIEYGATAGRFQIVSALPTVAPANGITGEVRTFGMATCPSGGWLIANGNAVSRTANAALFALYSTTYGAGDGSTTFNLPDMRGEFARGWDNGRGLDPGRVFGTTQTDGVGPHTHTATVGQFSNATAATFGGPNGFATPGSQSVTTDNGSTGSPATIAETRPKNVALLYCVKT